jgi:hypothetical protein
VLQLARIGIIPDPGHFLFESPAVFTALPADASLVISRASPARQLAQLRREAVPSDKRPYAREQAKRSALLISTSFILRSYGRYKTSARLHERTSVRNALKA